MYLYLVQHAEAKREEDDPSRSLSDKGVSDIKKMACFAAGLNLNISQIFHSGKTRSFQTARILAAQLNPDKGISESDGLMPNDDPEIWLKRLSRFNQDIILSIVLRNLVLQLS